MRKGEESIKMKKENKKSKSYWCFLFCSLLVIIVLRISAVITSEVSWICYLIMSVWALFWIDNHLTVF